MQAGQKRTLCLVRASFVSSRATLADHTSFYMKKVKIGRLAPRNLHKYSPARSCTEMPHFRPPTSPAGHADRRSAQGVRSTTRGESKKRTEESLLSSGRFRLSPAPQAAVPPPSFPPIDFYVTHRFFVSFLVRPALLPYGKRRFRAAIYKIARPQPPTAAL